MKLLSFLRRLKPPEKPDPKDPLKGWHGTFDVRLDPDGQARLDLPDDAGGANDGQGGYYDYEAWEDGH